MHFGYTPGPEKPGPLLKRIRSTVKIVTGTDNLQKNGLHVRITRTVSGQSPHPETGRFAGALWAGRGRLSMG